MRRIISITLLFTSLAVFGQNHIRDYDPEVLFRTEGEIYFSLPDAADKAGKLTHIISIDRVEGNTVYAYANKNGFTKLLSEDISDFRLLTHPGDLIHVEMTSDLQQLLDWNYYPTYDAYEEIMAQFAADYPDICKLYNLGTLPSGRKLLTVRISDNVGVEEDEPEFLYTSTMHGDETTGYVLMLHLIDYLLSNYNQDPRVTQIINNTDLWINPLANPDGTYCSGNHTVNGARRGNANNIDLNRNYPDPVAGPHPDGNPWQHETMAFMSFAEERDFVMSANFHGGVEVANYPWDTWKKTTADNDWWIMVCREYADTAQFYAYPGYFKDLNNGITNGYSWYSITGGRQDYMNYFQQCREATMEISATKMPPQSQLPNFWNYNRQSFLNYLEQVQYGVRGIVTDTITGEPLKAQVFISGHDIDSSMVFSSLPVGNYHRLLKAGTYNLTFIVEGYLPKTLRNVVVTDKSTTVRNVKLWDGSPIPDFFANNTSLFQGESVQFFDNSGGNPNQFQWTFEGADVLHSTEKNPVVTYSQSGTYSVTLYVSNQVGGNQLTKEGYITVGADFLIGNPGAVTCYARFFDSNGPDGNYDNNEFLTTTFYSADPSMSFNIHFESLDIEQSDECISDALLIYAGADTTAPLIATICGSTIPDDIIVSSGAITFAFVSDSTTTGAGWEILLSCTKSVGMNKLSAPLPITVFPNPVVNSGITIQSGNGNIEEISLHDLSGRIVFTALAKCDHVIIPELNIAKGLYILSVITSNGRYSQKLVIGN